VDVATRRMSIERLGITVPVGSEIGTVNQLCGSGLIGNMGTVFSEHAFRNVPDRDFFNQFIAEASAAGYNLAAEQSGDLFSSGTGSKAELIVGAAIVAIKADVCNESMFGSNWRADAEMTVDWQVFDPLEKKIVFRVTNQGKVRTPGQQTNTTITIDGARAAFRAAAKNLVADPNFLAAVKDPRGGAPSSGNALFPEATSAAPTPTSATQIARLPLSTTDFRGQVAAIRDQVVTIRTPGGDGSGFYINSNLLLTNHHVIAGYTDVRITFFGGREIAGSVIASDARRDIALVKTEAQAFSGLPLRLENPEVASQVFVIGSPLDPKNEGSVSAGIVSGFREHDYGPMLQSDVGVTFGNSGGPMFDDKGNVIALTDLGIPAANGDKTQVNLFIPIADGLKKLNIELGPDPATAQK